MSILSKSVLAVVVCLSLVVLAGCGGSNSCGSGDCDDPVPECAPPSEWAEGQGDPVVVSGYTVTYMGSRDCNGTTCFCYLVEGNGEPPGLSHFTVGLPECIVWEDIVAYSPDGDVEFVDPDPTTGVRGLKWDFGLATDGSQMYCFTLDGNYGEGTIVVAVKAGQLAENAELPGPACPGE